MTGLFIYAVADQNRDQINQLLRLFPREDIDRARRDHTIKPLDKTLRSRVASLAAEYARNHHNGAWRRSETLESGAMGSLRSMLCGGTKRMEQATWECIAHAIDVVVEEDNVPDIASRFEPPVESLPAHLLGPEMPATPEPSRDNGAAITERDLLESIAARAIGLTVKQFPVDWQAIREIMDEVGV